MMKLLVVSCLVVLVLATSVSGVTFTNRKLDCQGYNLKPLTELGKTSYLKHPCNGIDRRIVSTAIEKFVLVEECLCNLVPKQALWESLVNHRVSDLYDKVEKIVEAMYPEITNEMSFFNALEIIQEQDKAFIWNKFAKFYKSPEEAGRFVKETCTKLYETFLPFFQYINFASEPIDNDILDYKLTTHDENLFKLVVSYDACHNMMDAIKASA